MVLNQIIIFLYKFVILLEDFSHGLPFLNIYREVSGRARNRCARDELPVQHTLHARFPDGLQRCDHNPDPVQPATRHQAAGKTSSARSLT